MEYKSIIFKKEDGYAIVQFNRPQVLNALNTDVMNEVVSAFTDCDGDETIGAIILTGNEKAFAAGADIKEMSESSMSEMMSRDNLSRWDKIRKIKKPIIAAVSGFALGGGCEVAMACDIIIASESAKFGQPEINIGVIPGAGGTQRLTRAVGKSKAMELILTGDMFSATVALQIGLVSKVVPDEFLLTEAIDLAKKIASKPPIAVRLAKESILKSFDTTLEVGLEFERRNFYSLFATLDQKEGMSAFIEKRKPKWQGK